MAWLSRHPAGEQARRDGAVPLRRFLQRWSLLLDARLPRGVGAAATAVLMAASLAYGVVKGDHVATLVTALKDARDGLANAAGFRIVSLALAGNHHLSREEVLAVAGVTGTTSLLFLDVEHARERLKTDPWIADATVLKLYPGELQIGVKAAGGFRALAKGRPGVGHRRRRHRAGALCGSQPDPPAARRRSRRRDQGEGIPRAARSLSAAARPRALACWSASGAGTCG